MHDGPPQHPYDPLAFGMLKHSLNLRQPDLEYVRVFLEAVRRLGQPADQMYIDAAAQRNKAHPEWEPIPLLAPAFGSSGERNSDSVQHLQPRAPHEEGGRNDINTGHKYIGAGAGPHKLRERVSKIVNDDAWAGWFMLLLLLLPAAGLALYAVTGFGGVLQTGLLLGFVYFLYVLAAFFYFALTALLRDVSWECRIFFHSGEQWELTTVPTIGGGEMGALVRLCGRCGKEQVASGKGWDFLADRLAGTERDTRREGWLGWKVERGRVRPSDSEAYRMFGDDVPTREYALLRLDQALNSPNPNSEHILLIRNVLEDMGLPSEDLYLEALALRRNLHPDWPPV